MQVPMLFDRLLQAPHVVSLDSPNPHLDVWWCRSVHHYRPLVSGCTSPQLLPEPTSEDLGGRGLEIDPSPDDESEVVARSLHPKTM